MGTINLKIETNIRKILLIFFILQPVLDVIAAFTLNCLNIQLTLSSIIRFVFLFFCLYYLIFLSNERKNLIYLSILFIYLLSFSLITIFVKDFNVLFFELKNFLNAFYFPLVFLSLTQMFKQYDINIKIKYIVYLYLIYIVLILVPNITHTAFVSYSESKLGFSGWFLSANSVGNILSILFPFVILYVLTNEKKYLFKSFLILSSLFVFFSMGTKTPLLSFVICLFLTFVFYFVKWIRKHDYKKIVISIASSVILSTCFVFVIPKTSFYKNIQIHKNYLNINSYLDIFKDYELIDHFIFSQRLTFLNNTKSYYNNVDIFQKLFGIGYIENYGTDLVSTKTIEMDYFDVFYRNGIIGFCLFFGIFIYVFAKNKRKYNISSLHGLELLISQLLVLLLALFSGHVLVSPSVSIFVVIVFIMYFQGGLYEKID